MKFVTDIARIGFIFDMNENIVMFFFLNFYYIKNIYENF